MFIHTDVVSLTSSMICKLFNLDLEQKAGASRTQSIVHSYSNITGYWHEGLFRSSCNVHQAYICIRYVISKNSPRIILPADWSTAWKMRHFAASGIKYFFKTQRKNTTAGVYRHLVIWCLHGAYEMCVKRTIHPLDDSVSYQMELVWQKQTLYICLDSSPFLSFMNTESSSTVISFIPAPKKTFTHSAFSGRERLNTTQEHTPVQKHLWMKFILIEYEVLVWILPKFEK